MKKYLIIVVVAVLAVGGYVWKHNSPSANKPLVAQPSTKTYPPNSTPAFDKTQYSTTNPSSIWLVVNKQHPLNPIDYTPNDLTTPNIKLRTSGSEMTVRKATATALEQMFAAAGKDGFSLMLSSGYRSYQTQVNLYNHYVQVDGQAKADQESARPGYSEHQTGWAADIEPASGKCDVEPCFANTPEGQWLATNAYKFGFIVRYTAGNESVTGYEPEAWHVRYVGAELSTYLHAHSIATLEQFFGISGGAQYKTPS